MILIEVHYFKASNVNLSSSYSTIASSEIDLSISFENLENFPQKRLENRGTKFLIAFRKSYS